jgi:hypothetical protein
MDWAPISEDQIWDEITHGRDCMSAGHRRIWDVIPIIPEQWRVKMGEGPAISCWVVALVGRNAIYYNDIEEGFEYSPWSGYGAIDLYQCNSYSLAQSVQRVIDILKTGVDVGPYSSGPFPGEHVPS